MAHDIQSSSSARKRRWRARKRAEKAAAIAEAKRLHREALDVARVARGLLPLKLAKAESLAKFREKQKRLRERIRTSWFGPPLSQEEWDAYAKEQGWDCERAAQRRESFERAARISNLHLNRFLLENYAHVAVDARLRFHTAFLIHGDIRKAWECADTMKVTFKGSTALARELDRQQKYEDAMIRWREGDEIAAVILTGKYVPEFDE